MSKSAKQLDSASLISYRKVPISKSECAVSLNLWADGLALLGTERKIAPLGTFRFPKIPTQTIKEQQDIIKESVKNLIYWYLKFICWHYIIN